MVGNYKLEVITALTEESILNKIKEFYLKRIAGVIYHIYNHPQFSQEHSAEDFIGLTNEQIGEKIGFGESHNEDESILYVWYKDDLVLEFVEPIMSKVDGGRYRAFIPYREIEDENNEVENNQGVLH